MDELGEIFERDRGCRRCEDCDDCREEGRCEDCEDCGDEDCDTDRTREEGDRSVVLRDDGDARQIAQLRALMTRLRAELRAARAHEAQQPEIAGR